MAINMIKLIQKPKHYLIRWVDAESWSNWHSDEEVIDRIKSEFHWVDMAGWILYEDEKMIVLSTKQSSGGFWSNVYKIPKGWVLKRKQVREKL